HAVPDTNAVAAGTRRERLKRWPYLTGYRRRLRRAAHLYDILDHRSRAKSRPSLGERPAFLEQITAAIGGFHLVANRVCQRHFRDLARKACLLGAPVAK